MTLWKKFSQKWLERTMNHHYKCKDDNCELCKQFLELLVEEKLDKIPIVFLWDQFHAGIIE